MSLMVMKIVLRGGSKRWIALLSMLEPIRDQLLASYDIGILDHVGRLANEDKKLRRGSGKV
ncbi:NmrA-like family protein [Aspergillus luchuensis]|uniref:NmrA-like family protein n=1 Tax=Aspergillus kawachii TaxID=1069201 RepID=A0A146G118_ASPKA|nr:NmrA-like family protein [Aspergillus luchuensis]